MNEDYELKPEFLAEAGTDIVIPAVIDGVQATTFKQAIKNFTDLDSLTISKGITNVTPDFQGGEVGDFRLIIEGNDRHYVNLGNIMFSTWVETIGKIGSGASIELPENVSKLNTWGCSNLVSVDIEYLGTLDGSAFDGCYNLEAVNSQEYGTINLQYVNTVNSWGTENKLETADLGINRTSGNLTLSEGAIPGTITKVLLGNTIYLTDDKALFNQIARNLGLCDGDAWAEKK